MSIKEYFGDWWSIIDEIELHKVLNKIETLYKTNQCTPSKKDIFKAFTLCTRSKCKVIFIGQSPYIKKEISTGLAFANNKSNIILSSSLNILKNCCIDLEIPHNICIFDPSLEYIASQGVLFLNASLTTEVNKINYHKGIWYNFTSSLLKNLSEIETGLIYILCGSYAKSFRSFISNNNYIIECESLDYYENNNLKAPVFIIKEIDKILKSKYGETIQWYLTI